MAKRILGKNKVWSSLPARPSYAEIAQLAEHVIGNDEVPGSIPGLGSSFVEKLIKQYATAKFNKTTVRRMQTDKLLDAQKQKEGGAEN